MDKKRIKKEAYGLLKKIWLDQDNIWPKGAPTAIEMIDPQIACGTLNVKYEEHPELKNLGNKHSQIAGLIDRQSRKIAVATNFSHETMRFTAAHEIGHWLLHPNEVMHRDRPINSLQEANRSPQEKEADYFAACFLMPENLLAHCFEEKFLTIPFHFDDNSSYMLNPNEPDTLLWAEEGSLNRAINLARCESYNGRRFYSLAKQFRVSVTAMAIRLEELGFIKWP